MLTESRRLLRSIGPESSGGSFVPFCPVPFRPVPRSLGRFLSNRVLVGMFALGRFMTSRLCVRDFHGLEILDFGISPLCISFPIPHLIIFHSLAPDRHAFFRVQLNHPNNAQHFWIYFELFSWRQRLRYITARPLPIFFLNTVFNISYTVKPISERLIKIPLVKSST